MKKLKDLIVGSITLVSSDKTPAVEKATTKYSIFKTFEKGFRKGKINKEQKEKLLKIAEWFKKTLKKWL